MVTISFAVPLFALVLLFGGAHAAVTVCPKEGSIQEGLKYHSDTQCDRAQYNSFKCGLGRHHVYQKFKALKGIGSVANQNTIKCPAGGALVQNVDEARPDVGMDTVWFVENAASTPIVISYLNEEGAEVSAKNPSIRPAIRDPEAVLAPGSWMAVYCFEGHQFVVREVLKSGVAGNVLLQHRAGLIPIGAYAPDLECPLEDVEPIVNETRAPAYARTEPQSFRPCNTMDIGFRNVAQCPLNVYYVHGEGDSCSESFKFHLGRDSEVDDFMWDWKSQTKYEGTFIGHSFHFRLASNPSILVDTHTLQPTIVTDCPSSGVALPVSSQGELVNIDVGAANLLRPNSTLDDFDFNATLPVAHQPLHGGETI